MHRSICCHCFWRVGISGIGQVTPAGVWHTIDDKTGEVSSEVRITDNAGVLSGRIEKAVAQKRQTGRCLR